MLARGVCLNHLPDASHGQPRTEFVSDNVNCLSIARRCDGRVGSSDGSDEAQCYQVIKSPRLKKNAPISEHENHDLSVKSVSINYEETK